MTQYLFVAKNMSANSFVSVYDCTCIFTIVCSQNITCAETKAFEPNPPYLSVIKCWVQLLSFRMLIIDNFIPPDEKTKILSRSEFDEEEDTWKLKPLAKGR